MPKTKSGEVITWKEFYKRWKLGVEGIGAYQQTKMQIQSIWIIIIGLLCGITICTFNLKTLWWLMIILIGGLYNSSIQLLNLYQKKKQIKQWGLLEYE